MKRALAVVCFGIIMVLAAGAEFSFWLIDNFEGGQFDKWYKFGNIAVSVAGNPSPEARDVVAESCGDYALALSGGTDNWYVGGLGRDLQLDAASFSRLQLDVYGGERRGKIKVELFDDDNGNYLLEQDATHDWLPTKDDKWVAEVPVLGRGWTRISIPFTAFQLENPGAGDGVWNPVRTAESGGLLKVQLVLLTDKPKGAVSLRLDNILFTY